MTVKKAIELIEQNNRRHQEDIKLYDEVLKKYEESNKIRPPHHELAKQQQEMFLGLIAMNKATKEVQIKFNQGIINLLNKKLR